ncbi:MAG: hypothetical protein INR69_18930, partial [Mucilaginibacter polytrichastri]|nr:hypothetical protein [Mucilaginibacter polytrichastri]
MRYNSSFLRPVFLRQLHADDCGTACLGMLLRVSGMQVTGEILRQIPVPPGGLSLLDLRQEASRFGIHGRCARMDLDTLSGMDVPAILLIENVFSERHYCLCFGSR